jgi:RNA polymerase sigma factor (sigma-70 family)
VHCYRMLGSFADAEDAVQETMLAAWQGIGGFTEERASLRTWLYKIATNRCLNARRAASRRPAREWDVSQFEAPVPTPRDEPIWLQPFPDALSTLTACAPAVTWQLRRTRHNQDQPYSGLHTFAGIPHRLRCRLRRRALRLQERVGYPIAESQQAGPDQCCRQGAAPPDGVG